MSTLTTEDVSLLGPLLCDLQPSQLRLMAPTVLNSSLMAMASCEHIPRSHRADVDRLLKESFGWVRFPWTLCAAKAEWVMEIPPSLPQGSTGLVA